MLWLYVVGDRLLVADSGAMVSGSLDLQETEYRASAASCSIFLFSPPLDLYPHGRFWWILMLLDSIPQDLKDFGREAGSVSFADIDRDVPGQG